MFGFALLFCVNFTFNIYFRNVVSCICQKGIKIESFSIFQINTSKKAHKTHV